MGKVKARSLVRGIVLLKSVVLIDADMASSLKVVQAAQSDPSALFKPPDLTARRVKVRQPPYFDGNALPIHLFDNDSE